MKAVDPFGTKFVSYFMLNWYLENFAQLEPHSVNLWYKLGIRQTSKNRSESKWKYESVVARLVCCNC